MIGVQECFNHVGNYIGCLSNIEMDSWIIHCRASMTELKFLLLRLAIPGETGE
jgi:hypothetical protein